MLAFESLVLSSETLWSDFKRSAMAYLLNKIYMRNVDT